MATRSEIINKAFGRKTQGKTDTYWSYEQKNDYFHDAQDMIAAAICDADLPFFLVSDYEITKNEEGEFTLPDDLRSVRKVLNGDSTDEEIMPYDDEVKESGYAIENGIIVMKEWSGETPSKIVIDYRKFPKEIPIQESESIDPEDPDVPEDPAGDSAYVPDAPLHTNRGARILASVIGVLADIDDENETDTQTARAQDLIDQFVDRMGTMYDNDQYYR